MHCRSQATDAKTLEGRHLSRFAPLAIPSPAAALSLWRGVGAESVVVVCVLLLLSLALATPARGETRETPATDASRPSDVFLLTDAQRHFLITPRVEVLADPAGTLSVSDFKGVDVAAGFKPNHGSDLDVADRDGVFWVRLRLQRLPSVEAVWVLSIPFPQVDLAELYVPDRSGGYRALHAGRLVPLADKELPHREPAFFVTVPAENGEPFYLRLAGVRELNPRLHLVPRADFVREQALERYLMGLFYGAIISMALYHLFLSIKVGLGIYREFAYFLASVGLALFLYHGALYEFLPFTLPPLVSDAGGRAFTALAIFWLLAFSRHFLRLADRAPGWDRFIRGLAAAYLVLIPALFFGWPVLAVIQDGAGVATALLMTGLAFYLQRSGTRTDLYITLSFVAQLAGYVTDMVFYYGFGYLLGHWVYVLSTLGQATLVSLALASYINVLRAQQEKARSDAVAHLRENLALKAGYNRQLEQEIGERTAEIAAKNQALAMQAEQLRANDALKSRFFANVSHEFRTPLTLIRGPLEELVAARYGELSPEVVEHLKLSVRNTAKLQTLIDELLTLSKLEAGRLQLRASQAPLIATLRSHLSAFSSLAELRDIDLQLSSDVDEIALYFDDEKLERVVANLLGNALKFTPPGGRVRVRVEDAPPRAEANDAEAFVRIRVEDTGPGIAPDALPRVFERFYQGLRSDVAEGTGIGLALVKELTELHGGEVQAESTPGVGSVFTVSLPVGRAHLSDAEIVPAMPSVDEAPSDPLPVGGPAPAASVDTDSAADARPSVLLVEDNLDMRAYLRGHLVAGYRVVEAGDGAEGLRLARQAEPALIISDVMMPEMDGFAFVEALRADQALSHVPVILLSARGELDDRLTGLRARADDYLIKPFSPEELLLRVGNLIGSRAELRARHEKRVVEVPLEELEIDSADARFLEKVRAAVQGRVADNDFDVKALAKTLFVSEQTLRRRLDALVGDTPAAFIRRIRLDHARQLLEKRAVTSVNEAAYAVGFKSPGYFARLFRNRFDCSVQELLKANEPGTKAID